MCPLCLSSTAMLISGMVSTGGVAALVAKKLAGKFRKKATIRLDLPLPQAIPRQRRVRRHGTGVFQSIYNQRRKGHAKCYCS
jgi:hypothetical protein